MVVQQIKKYRAAAGDSGVQVWHQDGTGSTAYVLTVFMETLTVNSGLRNHRRAELP